MINTERLELIPLTARQLGLWVDEPETLENELNCRHMPAEDFFRDIIRMQIVKAENDPQNEVYHSFWWIVRKSDRVAVGSCGFKNVPGDKGEVEIGYGLTKEYEGAGYMTEAIKAFCDWALARPEVSCVIAETEADNPKSENVLKRVGFVLERQDETNWWRLS